MSNAEVLRYDISLYGGGAEQADRGRLDSARQDALNGDIPGMNIANDLPVLGQHQCLYSQVPNDLTAKFDYAIAGPVAFNGDAIMKN